MGRVKQKHGILYKIPETEEEIKEWRKCANELTGFFYFVNKYAKANVLRKGYVNIKLYPKQKEVIQAYYNNHKVIILKSRQIGISTVVAFLTIWLTLFYFDYSVGIVSKSGRDAEEFLKKIKDMIKELPPFLVQEPLRVSLTGIEFANNSNIKISTANPDAFRQFSLNTVILDEAAFATNIDKFYKAVIPTLSQNESDIQEIIKSRDQRFVPYGIIILSTAAKLDNPSAIWFKEMWENAIKGKNGYTPIKIHWSEVPYLTKEWYEERKKELNYNKDDIAMEYECKFIVPKEEDYLIPQEILTQLQDDTEQFEKYVNGRNRREYFEFTELDKYQFINPDWRIFVPISEIKQKALIFGIDPASGLGHDSFAIEVIDAETGEQLMEYENRINRRYMFNYVMDESFWNLFFENTVSIIVERNSYGEDILVDFLNLERFPFRDILYRHPQKRKDPDEWDYGFPTVKGTRAKLLETLRNAIIVYHNRTQVEVIKGIIKSPFLIAELLSFKRNKKTGRLEAAKGFHDDLVFAFALAQWARQYVNVEDREDLVRRYRELYGKYSATYEEAEEMLKLSRVTSLGFDVMNSELQKSLREKRIIEELLKEERRRKEEEIKRKLRSQGILDPDSFLIKLKNLSEKNLAN